MSYISHPFPSCEGLRDDALIQIGRHHTLPSDDPDQLLLIPVGSPTWIAFSKSDYELVKGLDGMRLGELNSSPAAMSTLADLFAAGLVHIGGQTGMALAPISPPKVPQEAKVSSLLIKMTGACNIACDYCYDYDPSRWESRLDVELAKQLIVENLSPTHTLNVMFHGGEPLIHFKQIKELVAFAECEAREAGNAITYSIQTNGLLLTEAVVDFLCEHSFNIGVSMDGPEHVHDLHRIDHQGRGTFRKLSKMFERFPWFMRQRVGYITVATPRNIGFLEDAWEFFQREGVSTWKVLPCDPEGRASDDPESDAFLHQFIGFVERRLQEVFDGRSGRPYLFNLTQLIEPLISPKRNDMCMSLRCGSGNDLLVLDAKGALRGCDCTYNDQFKLDAPKSRTNVTFGAIRSKTNLDLYERTEWLLKDSDCVQCPWLHFCSGTCPARALTRNGTLFSVDQLECMTRKILFPRMLSDLAKKDSKLRQYYRDYSMRSAERVAGGI